VTPNSPRTAAKKGGGGATTAVGMPLEEIFATARPPAAVSVAPVSGRWSCGFLLTLAVPWKGFFALDDGPSSVQTCCFRKYHPGMHQGISTTTATADDIRSTNEWTLGLRFLV